MREARELTEEGGNGEMRLEKLEGVKMRDWEWEEEREEVNLLEV